MKLIDISMMLSSETPNWPGDTPFHYEVAWPMEESGSVNVGKIETSTHMGTHIDAPFHYDENGKTTDELDLNRYFAKAEVIDCTGIDEITREHIELKGHGITAVLFKTTAWRNRNEFPESIPVMNEAVPAYLKSRGINLIGVDLPSVDHLDSKPLPIHHALHQQDINILEGIVLDEVESGSYQLIAMPLKIKDGDGSPVRAVLISE
ncbi:arylformamidase [Jeotgalibacillus haloalkalitolerans]|uniref:Kynurenine formamidase n=1 Tax=Jeotgalibacillus haloalkalitolerans TaxID=3104292 RepID=A0ABU5KPB4_9BACL|nr:arylformamidase [Jeotgalibacillus sp. HH7-29]MDZ5713104.1 arylformamidase [Jeotgalibacillus sp. HH7-29]